MAVYELSSAQFTPDRDVYDGFKPSNSITVSSPVDMLTGNDVIKGYADSPDEIISGFVFYGILMYQSLRLGPDSPESKLALRSKSDDDKVTGMAISKTSTGVAVRQFGGITLEQGNLSTGFGKDKIKGTGHFDDKGQGSPSFIWGIWASPVCRSIQELDETP